MVVYYYFLNDNLPDLSGLSLLAVLEATTARDLAGEVLTSEVNTIKTKVIETSLIIINCSITKPEKIMIKLIKTF